MGDYPLHCESFGCSCSGSTISLSFEKTTDEERALVEQMSSVGIPQESICLVIRDGVDDKTLRKHFRRELDTAAIRANAAVAGALYKSALEG
jgi:hypothetical protein